MQSCQELQIKGFKLWGESALKIKLGELILKAAFCGKTNNQLLARPLLAEMPLK